MFTEEERTELLRHLDRAYDDMHEAIDEKEVLPESITHNAERVGVPIQTRRISPASKTSED